ncbi:MAG: DUF1232 domain-containing protein [Chloroflexi bacterium]|nr:DUF1232 domain-containing protein [Chloroflexota bacterium]
MPNKKPSKITIPPDGGGIRGLVMRIKLVSRLMSDPRVNPLLKLLPLASLAYLIWPIDLAPGIALPVIGALDDAAVLWLGVYLFLEFCPPDIVQEHVRRLTSNVDIVDDANEDVVDAEVVEMPDDRD